MKLYQIILKKFGLYEEPAKPVEKAEEEKIYNPIGCKCGGVVKIDALDLREHRFTVKDIREYSISLGGERHRMVDYTLLSRPIGKPDYTIRLRLVPDQNSKSKVTHRAVVMSCYDSLAYNEGLHDVVRDDTKKFVIDDDKSDENPDNDTHEEFWRVNDVGSSYVAKLKVLADTDGDGKVQKEEVSKGEIEFWDYSRMTDMDGVEGEEFVFVEMDKANGWFQIWRGAEVNPERIDVF